MPYLQEIRMDQVPDREEYPFNIPSIRFIREKGGLTFPKPVTFFVGENGTGKSTLLEAIAVAMGYNAEGGSGDFSFSTRDTHADLYRYIDVCRTEWPEDGFFLRAESFYNTASYLDETSNLRRYGGRSFHEQSHGESFFSLIANRFEGNGLYLLDEPEAALSPQRLLSLLVLVDDLVKANSQFIISTHSPILMAYPHARIIEFSDRGLQEVAFRETAHYKLTKQFIDQPERMIQYLLGEQTGDHPCPEDTDFGEQ